ncbi:hypothetical protein [Kytococcus sedentarius]|uniref:hypothetical protein n=1 Tax=Kytococcus sedentarius TaxID=1276 RepID=UPI0035BBDEB3
MRAPRALSTLLATTSLLILAACSGGPDALDQAESREVLLSGEDLPLDGYTQGAVAENLEQSDQADPHAFRRSFEQFGSLGDECSSALDRLGTTLTPKDVLQSKTTGEYTSEDRTLTITVGGTTTDPSEVIEALRGIGADCETLEQDQPGTSVVITFEEVEHEGMTGSSITVDLNGMRTQQVLGARAVGDNLVLVMTKDVGVEDAATVLEAQAQAVEDH